MEKVIMYGKLRERIKSKYRTFAKFAETMGMDACVLSRKLAGDMTITRRDMIKWGEALGIPKSQYYEYFFD